MKIIYFYHIPKCGGTTVRQELSLLADSLGGEFYNFNTRMLGFGPAEKQANDEALTQFFDRIDAGNGPAFQFVHHHHGYWGLYEIRERLIEQRRRAKAAGHEFLLFTCIREPLDFQISQVNFLRNSCGMTDLTFDDACRDRVHWNFMSSYLLYNHPRRRSEAPVNEERLLQVLGLMDRVFVLERFEELRHWLKRVSGSCMQDVQMMLNQGNHSLLPTAEQVRTLRSANSLDHVLYGLVCDGLQDAQAAWS